MEEAKEAALNVTISMFLYFSIFLSLFPFVKSK